MQSNLHAPALLATAAGVMMVAAACGSPSVAPATSVAPPPTQSVAAQPASSTAPSQPSSAVASAQGSQSAQAQSSASAPASASSQGSASQSLVSSPAAAASGNVAITLNSTDSKAQYQAHEVLVGHDLPTPAVGTTSAISGAIVLSSSGSLVPSASKITVDLSTLTSDKAQRDNFIKRNPLQTSQYPDAVFTATQATGLTSPLPTAGPVTFTLQGNLTVHGVTKPTTWTVSAQVADGKVSGKATAPFTITEFGMGLPKAGPVLSVEDAGTLELDFTNAPIGASPA